MGRKEKREEKKIKVKKTEKIFVVVIFLVAIVIGIIGIIKMPVNVKNNGSGLVENSDGKENIVCYSLEKDEKTNTIKILFTIKSDIGVKKVELPDGSEYEYNNDKEVKLDYIVERNGEYIINIKEKDEKITQEKIEITAIS